MTLYETLSGQICTSKGLSDSILSTIGVKHFPLSPTLFGLQIDELEPFILEIASPQTCILHGSHVPILLFTYDIVLLSHTIEGIQCLVNTLDSFNSKQELIVNLSKTNVLAFNVSKHTFDQIQITYRNKSIEMASSYTSLGILFSRPRFMMKATAPPRVRRGYVAVSSLKRQCVQLHFQDILSKLQLFHTLGTPTVLYGVELWGPRLRGTNWDRIETILINTLSHSIQSKRIITHHIILEKFGYQPLKVWALARLVLYLQRLQGFTIPSRSDKLPQGLSLVNGVGSTGLSLVLVH